MTSINEANYITLLRKSPKTEAEIVCMQQFADLFLKELKDEISDLSAELKAVNPKLADPWDMVNTNQSYPEAVDILVEHIHRNYHDKNKEGIFRALTTKQARGKANKELLDEFEKIPKTLAMKTIQEYK